MGDRARKRGTTVGDFIAALDVGTTKICAMIAEIVDEDTLAVVGVGAVPARGVRRGMVVNVQEVTTAIGEAVAQAERAANVRMANAFVSLSGASVEAVPSRGVATISSRPTRTVSQEDIRRALENASAIALPPHRQVVQTLPRSFKVDDQEGIREPLGMDGFRLEVDALVITASTVAVQNLVKCVRANGIEVDDLVLQALASGLAVLTPEEQELGVAVMDVGGGTTDVALFMEGSLWYTVATEVAGHYLTQDVAIGLRMPLSAAEDLKVRYGHVQPQWVSTDETITVGGFGNGERRTISRHLLAQILEARAEEILDLAWKEVKASGYDGLIPAGVVLTGGTAQLAGFRDLARERLQVPVRVGVLPDLQGLGEEWRTPAYATAVGLLFWGLRHTLGLSFAARGQSEVHGGWWGRFSDWLKRLLPEE